MPRSIIDVEKSRPAYERRRVRMAILLLVVFGLLATGVWFAAVHSHTQPRVAPVPKIQGKSAR